jgi:hypothetical protein
MDVHITQFNVQLYFKKLIDTDKLNIAFCESEGIAASPRQQAATEK